VKREISTDLKFMSKQITHESDERLASLIEAVGKRQLCLSENDRGGYVGSELPALDRAFARIQKECLSEGPVFCDWGSGLGEVCCVAAMNQFTPVGIEIQVELVDAARSLAADLGFSSVFVQGSFLQPGDEDLVSDAGHTELEFDTGAWDELVLAPKDCHLIYGYPWPGEEEFLESVFTRHASPGALLVTYHDRDYVLVQRQVAEGQELLTLGWM
jgi:hypothetical protein